MQRQSLSLHGHRHCQIDSAANSIWNGSSNFQTECVPSDLAVTFQRKEKKRQEKNALNRRWNGGASFELLRDEMVKLQLLVRNNTDNYYCVSGIEALRKMLPTRWTCPSCVSQCCISKLWETIYGKQWHLDHRMAHQIARAGMHSLSLQHWTYSVISLQELLLNCHV